MTESPSTPEAPGNLNPGGKFILRLYVAGNSRQSTRAVERARAFCETHLKGAYELTVIDLYQEPERVGEDEIVALPALVKQLPPPLRQLIGDLSDTGRLFVALDLDPGGD